MLKPVERMPKITVAGLIKNLLTGLSKRYKRFIKVVQALLMDRCAMKKFWKEVCLIRVG